MSNVSLESKRRILTEDPPDLWASWAGPTLGPYQNAGVLGDLTDVWTESDMERAFHDTAREAVRFDGAYRGVPLNVQRTNLLFHNVELVERAGVDPVGISDPREFLEVLGQVDDAIDENAFVMGFVQPFASQGLYMWEGIYLGLHGPDSYSDLVDGEGGRHRSEVESALSVLDRLFEYANDDAIIITEGDEEQRFFDQQAAFRMQGMWSGLGLAASDIDYGTDWGITPQPGTQGSHVINMDGSRSRRTRRTPSRRRPFSSTRGRPTASSGSTWPRSLSRPGRTPPLDGYPDFLQEQARDFRRTDSHLPSIAHGFAVSPELLVDLEIAFSEFINDRDVDRATDEFVSVFSSIE